MILSICELPDVLKVMRIVNIVIQIIRIVVPIILIVSAMKDLVRAINDAELNKITKPMVSKVVAAILVFLIPSFVSLVATIAGNDGEYKKCLVDISTETINNAYVSQAETLIKQAEKTLKDADYSTALYYLNNIKDESKKKELKKKLDEVKEKIEEKKEQAKPKATAPIKPPAGENVIRQEEKETLKIYITQRSGYYVTRAWMKDPYTQINKRDADPYGYAVKHPKDMLNSAIKEKNLQNKLVVGMNASGFYLKDVYDKASVAKYPAYNKTSVGTLVITNGQVVRNAYDKAFKTWYIAGIDKSNNLRIFEDLKASTQSEIDAKKTWANGVISSGIRNTFTFASPLIENGQASSKTTSMPSWESKVKRQAICQVDSNNFAFITGSSLSRQDLINIMLELKCKTGTNFDGGGSIALLYKPSSKAEVETITGGGRQLSEVLYITE